MVPGNSIATIFMQWCVCLNNFLLKILITLVQWTVINGRQNKFPYDKNSRSRCCNKKKSCRLCTITKPKSNTWQLFDGPLGTARTECGCDWDFYWRWKWRGEWHRVDNRFRCHHHFQEKTKTCRQSPRAKAGKVIRAPAECRRCDKMSHPADKRRRATTAAKDIKPNRAEAFPLSTFYFKMAIKGHSRPSPYSSSPPAFLICLEWVKSHFH